MSLGCRVPGKKALSVIARDKKVVSPSLTREFDFVFSKAKGNFVFDSDNFKYLDFSALVAVMNAGHSNPEVVKAVKKQLSFGMHAAFADFYAELPVQFSEYLLSLLPGYGKAFLSNSGTEAVEAAIKLAKWNSGKKYLIAFKNSFHGRTMGSLSLTDSKKVQRDGFQPFLPVKHAVFPYVYRFKNMDEDACMHHSLGSVKKTVNSVKGNVAGIFLEPIQGEGGYIVPPKEFPKALHEFCESKGILLCSDEVQSGCFRTGKFLALENFNAKADIVSLSKAIGGGIPLGATVSSSALMKWPAGSHANTFGGNLLACSAGLATLKFLKEKKCAENAKKLGKFMLSRLEKIKENNEIVGDVRGLGLMIGIEIVKSKKSKKPAEKERDLILCEAFKSGLLMLPCGAEGISAIRICPPLTLTKKEAVIGLDILENSVEKVMKNA